MKTRTNRQKAIGWAYKKAFALCLLLFFGILAQAAEIERVVVSNIIYDIDKEAKEAQVVGLEEDMVNVGIPSSFEYDGTKYIVTSLGDRCFQFRANIKAVNIPSSVKSMGTHCFYDCRGLETVSIPSNVETIGGWCFQNCTSLSEVLLPEGLEELPNNCFLGCNSLVSIRIPESVKKIGVACFSNCKSLKVAFVLSEDYCELGRSCFIYCPNLRYFIIHAKTPPAIIISETQHYGNVDQLGGYYYYKKIYVPSDYVDDYKNSELFGRYSVYPIDEFQEEDIHEGLYNLSDGRYSYRGLYYTLDEENGTASVVGVIDSYYYTPSPGISDGRLEVTKVLIPERVSYKGKVYPVTSIGDRCFYEYRSLCSITIPSMVKSLGVGSFIETGLSSVILPEGLESIGAGCFQESRLTSIDIPSSVTYIGDGCFLDAYWLTNIILRSKKLDYLGAGCFNADKLSQFVCYAEDVPQFEHEMWGRTYTPFLNDMISQKGTLYVQKELVDAYRVSEDWGRWKEILPIDAYDSTDGVSTVEGNKTDAAIIYDLLGRKVTTPQKNGLYIKNGKKFIAH